MKKIAKESIYDITKKIETAECKVYCFGAGTMGKDFADFAHNFGVDLYRLIFVDNDKNKHNKTISVHDTEIQIVSKQQMLDSIDFGDVIVIATLACKEIYDELMAEEKLKDTCVYFSQLLLLKSTGIGGKFVLSSAKEQLIPKIIHYCWFGGSRIPSEFQKYIDGWKEKCPDYEITEWNESNYDITKNLYMKQAYEQKRWGFVPDYARLDIVYNNGGIFLDTDVEVISSFDSLLFNRAFFSLNSSLKPNLGNGFGAELKNLLIKKMRDYYECFRFVKENGEVNAIPCTEYQYVQFKENGFEITGRGYSCKEYVVLPFDIMCGYNQWIDKYNMQNDTVSVHHCKRTWHDDTQKKRAKESVEFLRELLKS